MSRNCYGVIEQPSLFEAYLSEDGLVHICKIKKSSYDVTDIEVEQ